ncbi:ABC transporter substrate-binding protein [Caballeronia cordobensis]|uniref:ABC transporter substrate-binding protein n=1 Tax=Caballeronia cordobensis TaxID=1353886 RepID=UPI00045F04CF|nr:putative membrane protein [Burkholderia sp. RPE67]
MDSRINVSRRKLLMQGATTAAAVALGGNWSIARAKPSKIVVATSGGALEAAYRPAYYKPWIAKTGIEIVSTANTYAKLKAMIDANAVEWDVAQLDGAVAATFAQQGLLEPLDYSIIDKSPLLANAAKPNYVISDVVGCVVAWNTQRVTKAQTPENWTDVFDLKRFAGQRGFWKQAYQTLEIALLADGVPKSKLYPLDVDRALKSLEKIRSEIFWWGSGAQSAQILSNGDVSAEMGWNGRLIDLRKSGAPIDYHFNDSLFVGDAWVVPKGSKNKKEAMEFIALALDAKNQATFAGVIPYGPTNKNALQYIDKARMPDLPSSEQNYSRGVLQDFDWWGANGAATGAKFDKWLLG